MANKTIHQLTPASTITSDTQFAIYDTVSDSTKKATASQILGTEDILYADDPSTPSGTVDFTTQDTSLNPASTVSVDLLTGSDSWSQRFVKISQMFKNVRYLLGKLGSTDISSIGDGSVTGAVSTLNSNLNELLFRETFSLNLNTTSVPANNTQDFTFNISKTGYTPIAISSWIIGGGGPNISIIYATIGGTNDSQAILRLMNRGSSAVTPNTIAVAVLYKKDFS